MISHVVEKVGFYKSMIYVVVMQKMGYRKMGYRCGYVGIEEGSKYYKVNLDNIDAHITYSKFSQDYPIKSQGRWWIGFDCAHYNHGLDSNIAMQYEIHSNTIPGIDELYKNYDDRSSYYDRSLYDVENWCKKIIEQILENDDNS